MDTVQELLTGLKKIPTALAGGPVDLSNLVLGVISGKGLSGLTEKPVGGSAWLNEKFGIEGGGLVSDAVELIGSSINPATAAKSLAILVPALVTKDANTVLKAQRALRKGADPHEVFADTGIYQNPASGDLMSVISDAEARLRPEQLRITSMPSVWKEGPFTLVSHNIFESSALEDLMYHPELYDRVPELKDIPVSGLSGGYNKAAYYADGKNIRVGPQDSLPQFLSITLHETQHAVQDLFSLPRGGMPENFLSDPKALEQGIITIQDLKQSLKEQIKKGVLPAESSSLADSLESHVKLLQETQRSATRGYLSLAGEAEARLVEEMYQLGPEFSRVYPPMLMEAELGSYGLDIGQLINKDTSSIRKVDQDPVVQAILDFARRQRKP